MEEKIIHMYISDDGKYSDKIKERVEKYEQDKIKEKEELEKAEKNLEKYISASFSLDETIYYLVEFNYAYTADIGLKTPLGLREALKDRYPYYKISFIEEIKKCVNENNRVCYYLQDSGDYLDIYFVPISELLEKAKFNLTEAQNVLKILGE